MVVGHGIAASSGPAAGACGRGKSGVEASQGCPQVCAIAAAPFTLKVGGGSFWHSVQSARAMRSLQVMVSPWGMGSPKLPKVMSCRNATAENTAAPPLGSPCGSPWRESRCEVYGQRMPLETSEGLIGPLLASRRRHRAQCGARLAIGRTLAQTRVRPISRDVLFGRFRPHRIDFDPLLPIWTGSGRFRPNLEDLGRSPADSPDFGRILGRAIKSNSGSSCSASASRRRANWKPSARASRGQGQGGRSRRLFLMRMSRSTRTVP